MRFLLDENIHRGLLGWLTDQQHEVCLSPKGLTNGRVFALAQTERRILLTHDEDFARWAFPAEHAGAVLIKIPSRQFSVLLSAMGRLLLQRPTADQFHNRLTILFEDRFEQHFTAITDIPL